MPKLALQFEGRLLKEFVVGEALTIGRAPDNTVIIDNPAVSGHHARVHAEGASVVLEDLDSTNGTYVNGQHTSRRVMKDGDVVVIGRHQLVYDASVGTQTSPPAAPPSLDEAMSLDTAHGRELRASLEETRVRPVARQATKAPVTPSRIGVLQVIAGRAEQTAYPLVAHTSLIGKSGDALVRLKGWFKPAVAVAITRSSDGYIVMPMGGRPTINNERLQTRQPLHEGDVLIVHGLVLEFRWKNVAASEPAA